MNRLAMVSVVVLVGAGATPKRSLVVSNCDSADHWRGGKLSTETKKEGAGAILWDHGKSPSLYLQSTPGDWSRFNELSFWMHSPKATGAKFMMIVRSENEQTKGMDYYATHAVVDFTGWRQHRFLLPDDLWTARRPRGWDHIDELFFTASGWDNTPDPNTVVVIDHIVLSWEAERVGPRMTDAEFFAALCDDVPGLAEAHRLARAGDYPAAKAAFVAHIKGREKPRYFVDWRDRPKPANRPKGPRTRQADFALERKYTVCGVTLEFPDEIDWKANPTEPFNPEWTWQLGRFGWWGALGQAYWDTGDEKYADHFVRELRSWVHKNLMPRRVNNAVASRWRTIECGIRLAGSWPRAFNHFLSSPSMTDDDVVLMVKSLAEQADYLCRFLVAEPDRHNNWVAMEANGLGHVAVLFPELRKARHWRDTAIERIAVELDEQVYPDGPQMELTTGYHYVSLGNFRQLAEIYLHNDVPLPDDYLKKLERMWAAGMWAMMPNRYLPPVNDAWRNHVPRTLRDALRYFPDRQDFRWIASDGREGVEPDHTSHFFPWAGWAVMRTGWGKGDNYLFFDIGPFGVAHQHEDKLAFQIHAHGKYLLVDVGSYAYERSPMRSYVLSPYAHNTVFVDGGGQNRRGQRRTYANEKPQTNRWFTSESADYCDGAFADGFGPKRDRTVSHKREILFVKPDYWLVLDTLAPTDKKRHEYMALFHLGPDEAEANGVQVRTLDEGVNLHIRAAADAALSAEIVKGQETPYLLGWIGAHGVHGKRPMPVARFTWEAAGPSRVLYVFYPTKAGRVSPLRDFRATFAEDAIEADVVSADGRKDLVRIGPAGWKLDRGGTAGKGKATVIPTGSTSP